ncbi:MAG: aldo/keto reductase [bacterium]
MDQLSRREFMRAGALGAGAAAALPGWAAAREAKPESPKPAAATDRIEIGRSGIKVSMLAQGTGANGWQKQSDQTRLGMDGYTSLMRHSFDSGINFFDMADLYGSHPFMKNALQFIPRDQVVLLSKIWFAGGGGMKAATAAKSEIERFRQELGTDVIDICLVHCVTNPRWPEQQKQIREELLELKEKGVVKVVGCSCHSLEALRVAAEDPWTELIFSRINDKQKKMDGRPAEVASVLRQARKNGKFVVGMKIYGCGDLTKKEDRDASLRYVLDNKLVDAMTIGFTGPAQVDDSIGHIAEVLKG